MFNQARLKMQLAKCSKVPASAHELNETNETVKFVRARNRMRKPTLGGKEAVVVQLPEDDLTDEDKSATEEDEAKRESPTNQRAFQEHQQTTSEEREIEAIRENQEEFQGVQEQLSETLLTNEDIYKLSPEISMEIEEDGSVVVQPAQEEIDTHQPKKRIAHMRMTHKSLQNSLHNLPDNQSAVENRPLGSWTIPKKSKISPPKKSQENPKKKPKIAQAAEVPRHESFKGTVKRPADVLSPSPRKAIATKRSAHVQKSSHFAAKSTAPKPNHRQAAQISYSHKDIRRWKAKMEEAEQESEKIGVKELHVALDDIYKTAISQYQMVASLAFSQDPILKTGLVIKCLMRCKFKQTFFSLSVMRKEMIEHFEHHRHDMRWHGFCSRCSRQVHDPKEKLTLEDELEHIIECHTKSK
jgi:hypothetical protein